MNHTQSEPQSPSRPAGRRRAAGRRIGRVLATGTGILLLVGGLSAARADEHGDPSARQGDRLEHMASALELTADQRDQVKAILDASREQGRALWQEGRKDRDAIRERMKTLREDTRAKLAQVLTPDQMSRLDAMRDERRQKMEAHRAQRQEARFEHLSRKLELDSSQQGPVREILDASRDEARGILHDGRAQGLDRDAVRKEMEALRGRTEEKLAAVLTPAQMDTMKAMEARMRERMQDRMEGGHGMRDLHGRHGPREPGPDEEDRDGQDYDGDD